MALLIGVDLRTGGPKVALVSANGQILGLECETVHTRFLPGGGAEQDPEDWWDAITTCTRRLLAAQPGAGRQVAAICFSGQWGGTVAIDQQGNVLHPALISMDGRGAPYARAVTGGLVTIPGAGYSARKLRAWIAKTGGAPTRSGQDPVGQSLWLQMERPHVYAATSRLLDIPEYLTFRASGKAVATTDTAVLRWCTDNRDPRRVRWDLALARAGGLDPGKLPEIVAPATVVGTLTPQSAVDLRLPGTVQVVAGTGDTAAAAIGAGAIRDLEPHLHVDTSAWLTCHVSKKKASVLHSIAAMPSVVPGRYWVANVQNVAGQGVNWLMENVPTQHGPTRSSHALAQLSMMAASAPPGSHGVIFTPWLNGERTPVDDSTIRGSWLNLSLSTGPADQARAVFEGIAYNTKWMLERIEQFTGQASRLGPIRCVGDGASSPLWCQIMADVLERPIRQVEHPAAANARGAALLAGIGLGELSWEDVPALIGVTGQFEPRPEHQATYEKGYLAFRRHFRRNRAIYARPNGQHAV